MLRINISHLKPRKMLYGCFVSLISYQHYRIFFFDTAVILFSHIYLIGVKKQNKDVLKLLKIISVSTKFVSESVNSVILEKHFGCKWVFNQLPHFGYIP